MDFITFYILIVIFFATLVRSTFGFGQSLVAVPLLILYIPVEIAVPFSVLVSITAAAMIVVQDRKQIHFRTAKWLIGFAILGIPIGLLLLIYGNESLVKTTLGVLIVLYSVYSLLSKRIFNIEKNQKLWLFACGFLSGIFGGAYGLNGPPLAIYGNMRRWTAGHFRATLQAYFLPVSTVGMIGYWYNGLWTPDVTKYYLMSLPLVIPAIFLGRYFNKKLKDKSFMNYVYVGLLCVGILLVMNG